MKDAPQRPRPERTLFLPLALFMTAWLLWTGFQSVQLLRERSNLQTLYANQEQTVQTAQKMRQQLDALAAGTRRLANAGHPHATAIVQELARRGVKINP
ncbi:MAG: hypothetical protein H6973_12970 [Gammaproteobacteria bacterium]|nr:hypothetical protein [Gammaproteobacteria bacterium]HRX72204.1 hypothetical protein [Candidatus Competibacteraceae bacterium]